VADVHRYRSPRWLRIRITIAKTRPEFHDTFHYKKCTIMHFPAFGPQKLHYNALF
jgi:hypothetical protein